MSGHERGPSGPAPQEVEPTGTRVNNAPPDRIPADPNDPRVREVARRATREAGVVEPRTLHVGEQAVRGAQRRDGPETRRELGRQAMRDTVERPDEPERS